MQTEYCPNGKEFINENADIEKNGCWDLMRQFLGTPSRMRLTTMPTQQFLDLYFP